MTTSTELRALALKIADVCRESHSHSIAWPIINVACDHLIAIACVHEYNVEHKNRLRRFTQMQEDDYD